jgi:uncharacterized SAM-binding protein YcdF (DUF218 family)
MTGLHDWPVSRRERARRRAQRRRLRNVGLLVFLGAMVYLVGLGEFVRSIPDGIADAARDTDAIVVLTGGSQRLVTGLKLLGEGRSHRLFVSGVNRDVELSELLTASGQDPASPPCCITLGHAADDTIGNAVETAQWVAGNDIHSVRLVTAAYHMPRSLMELKWQMPDVAFVPNPVYPAGFTRDDWWRHGSSRSLVVGEYHKYIGAWLRHAVTDLTSGLI